MRNLFLVVSMVLMLLVGNVFACGPDGDVVTTPLATASSNANSVATATGTGVSGASADTTVTITGVGGGNGVRQDVVAPAITAVPFPLIINGHIGDVTYAMPKFYGLIKLDMREEIVEILDVENGNFLSRIREEDVETVILKKGKKYIGQPDVRYSVKFKDSVSAAGINGAGMLTNANPVTAITGAILPGFNNSTWNPSFVITFYRVSRL